MAIVIRHGSNGAMKSATAVDLYMIPAIKAGRPVVTNLRGVSLERCYEVFPDLPEKLEVIYVDNETSEGKDLLATWFHWAPIGALLIFDEASSLFPKSWRDSKISALDYPGGPEAAKSAGRPATWLEAWEMQRHYNWDVVLTTPNIKNIRDDIRNTTPMAFRQRSLGKFVSEKFRAYKQVQHDATKNGFSASDAISVSTGRVSKNAFKLYDSTKTGTHATAKMGTSALLNPKVLLLGSILALALYLGISAGSDSSLVSGVEPVSPAVVIPVEDPKIPVLPDSESVADVSVRRLSVLESSQTDFLANHQFRLLGSFDGTHQILITGQGVDSMVTPDKFASLGFSYFPISDCVGRLVSVVATRVILCGKAQKTKTYSPDSLVSDSVPKEASNRSRRGNG